MTFQSNPFSTRSIRPGALPYLFPDGQDANDLIKALNAAGWRGQIIGPHGSGKSTLLATLAGPLSEAGRPALVIRLHDGQRRMPLGWVADAQRAAARLIVVDGYEQLGRFGRLAVKYRCRQRGWGLLVTAHADVGLPTIFRTSSTLDVALTVVARLLPASEATIGRDAVARCFAAAGGNTRETLFALYDECEVRRVAGR